MIDVYFDLWNKLGAEVNTFQGGLWRPNRDFIQTVNKINFEIWNDYTAQAEKSQEITDELSPFQKSVNVIIDRTTQNYGLLKYKSDYGRFSSARILLHKDKTICDDDLDTCQIIGGECTPSNHKETESEAQKRIEGYKDGIIEKTIEVINNSKWGSVLNHRTKQPTFESPKMTQFDGGFKVAPRQTSVVIFDYYINPPQATFKYTLAPGNPQTGAGDYIIYDESKSKKLLWRESMIPEFINRLSKVYSKYTRDSLLFQMNKAG